MPRQHIMGAARKGALGDHVFDQVEDIRLNAEHIDELAAAAFTRHVERATSSAKALAPDILAFLKKHVDASGAGATTSDFDGPGEEP